MLTFDFSEARVVPKSAVKCCFAKFGEKRFLTLLKSGSVHVRTRIYIKYTPVIYIYTLYGEDEIQCKRTCVGS